MAKAQSFAEKAAKAGKLKYKKCPKCDTMMEPFLVVTTEMSKSGNWKFIQRRIKVCKCNEKEVFV